MRMLARIGPRLPVRKRLMKPTAKQTKHAVEIIQFLLSRKLKRLTLIQAIINDIQVA